MAWTYEHEPKAKEDEQDFVRRVTAIWDGYYERKSSKKGSFAPFDTAEGFFKRQAYFLFYEKLNSAEYRKMIDKIVTKSAYEPKKPTIRENPFHWALIAMFAIEGVAGDTTEKDDAKAVAAARKKIGRWGAEMLYARQNYITGEHLIGFLYQSACSKNIGKLINNGTPDPSLKITRIDMSEYE